MPFVEYVPFLNRRYNPEVALDLRKVKSHWGSFHDTAEYQLKLFSNIAEKKLPKYPLDEIDRTAILAGLTYHGSVLGLAEEFRDPEKNTLARGIEQRYDASCERLVSLFENVGDPLFGRDEHQKAYMYQSFKAAEAIAYHYEEYGDFKDVSKITSDTVVHLNLMRHLRAGNKISLAAASEA